MTGVSIIIVNWNSKQFLRNCLSSVRTHCGGMDYETIVIDSGSFDGAAELVRDEFPEVRFIQSQENLGFARANNVAYRSARGEYICFLNPDTQLETRAIERMHQFLASRPDAGAIGCTLLNDDGTLQTSCIQSFPTLLNQALSSEFLRGLFPRSRLWGMAPLYGDMANPSEVEVISGACVMVRREAFDRIGGFSEEYFMYAEDVDLCYKLREAGYANFFLPSERVRHFGGGSSAKAPSEFSLLMMRESIWRFLRKSRGSLYAAGYRLTTLLAAVFRILALCVLAPFALLRGRLDEKSLPIRKWLTILRWGLKIQKATVPV